MAVHGSPAPARCRCKRTNACGDPNDDSGHTNQIDVKVTAVSNKRCRLPAIHDVQYVQSYGFCHVLSRRRDCPRCNAVLGLWTSDLRRAVSCILNDGPSCW